MTVETVTGKSATIVFNGALCIHARRCVLSEPGVFKANVQGPWIDPDAASAEALMRVALNCPSGAIQVTRHDGGANETNPKINTIAVRENGPLAVNAEIALKGAPIGTRATLCRCGQSKNKPYCDNSHLAAAFAATGEPAHKRERCSREARRAARNHALSQRTARHLGRGRDHFGNRAHHQSRRERNALPLRPFGQQALLRRRAQESRVRRAVNERRTRPAAASTSLDKRRAFKC